MRLASHRPTLQPFRRIATVFSRAAAQSTATLSVRIVYICVGLFLIVALLDVSRIVDRQTIVIGKHSLEMHELRDIRETESRQAQGDGNDHQFQP